MTTVQVQEYGKSAGGKPKVKVSGKWFFLARDIDQPPMGAAVEIKEGSFRAGDSTYPTIEAWRPAGGNVSSSQQQNASAPAVPPAGYVDEASMRFISNCVGSAITAKTITEPGQIRQWFQAAKAAIKDEPADAPFNDRIPF